MKIKICSMIMLPILILSGCTTYKTQYASFRPPAAYPNLQVVDGASLGGEAYADKDAAEKAFGFDIKGAGLLPVQIVLENKSGKNLEIVNNQTFLVDDDNRYWNIIPTNTAIDRLEKSTQLAAFFGKGAGTGAVLGAAAGTILGAALGIVSGGSVGEATLRGAAVGAAGGAVIGGVKEGTSSEREYRITDDIRAKGLEGKVIPPQSLANGFVFFPGEAQTAKELRLQYREKESGKVHNVVLNLK